MFTQPGAESWPVMDDANGLKSANKSTMNGHTNGSLNGHAVKPRPSLPQRRAKASSSLVGSLISMAARLFTWYSIITILFRCPATLDACDETTPSICKPYFQLKHTVAPHLEPYYDTYAAPYVEVVRPYYEKADQAVLTPAWAYTTKYGAPRVAQAQAFARSQWDRTVAPQLVAYKDLAMAKYDNSLGPHVNQFTETVEPYYEIARTNLLQTYHDAILPTYKFIQPYAAQGYDAASLFTTQTAVPSAIWAWNKSYIFLDTTVWPHLRVIYLENVEPQLQKIGQRLGRYNGQKTPVEQKTVVESVTSVVSKASSSFKKPSSSTVTSTSSSVASSAATTQSSSSVSAFSAPSATTLASPRSREHIVAPEKTDGEESDVRRKAREQVAEDLKKWQDKYAKQADESSDEIEARVDEIAKRAVDQHAGKTGKGLVQKLQQTTVSQLVQLRRDILNIIGAVDKGSADTSAAQEQLTLAIRRAGGAIKSDAQAIRTWHEKYDDSIKEEVSAAADSHFKMLQSIRDLALQKIGMQWAWMEGVSYRDWAKFHALRERFQEWEDDLEKLIVAHPGLENAQKAGQAVEDEGMKLATSAAKELARLKQVAAWKLTALDTTNEFNSDLMEKAAKAAIAAKQSLAAAVESSTSAATEAASSVTSSVGSAVSAGQSAVSSVSDAISSSIESSVVPPLESVASDASSAASSIASGASESAASVVRQATSSETPAASYSAEEATSVVLEETPVVVGNTTEATEAAGEVPVELPVDEAEVADDVEEPSTQTTTSIKPVLFGVAAQSVPTRQPIIDDEIYENAQSVLSSVQSDLPATISDAASSAFKVAMEGAAERYTKALAMVSKQIKGTPAPAHEKLMSSLAVAYSSAISSASSRFDDAMKAANSFVTAKATPTPAPAFDWAHVEAIAAERLSQGRAWAEEQYESAKIAIGVATPTPTSPTEKLYENAKYNYYAGLGLAQARYSDFMAAASSAFSSMTATPTPTDIAGTLSSVASVASESANHAAGVVRDTAGNVVNAAGENISAGYESAASAASVAGESVNSAVSAARESAASAAAAAADSINAGYESVVSAASEAGTAVQDSVNAGYENVASVAAQAETVVQDTWEAAVSRISMQVYGAPTPTPWYESVANAAGELAKSATDALGAGADQVTSGTYVAQATDAAASQYSAVSSLLAELIVGKEPTFSESVYSRLSAAYVTGAASAASIANAASATAASVASDATAAVKEGVDRVRDEL